ncbi:MAG: nitroreductase/quinone reductase family protein [Chloroflexota bacterium]
MANTRLSERPWTWTPSPTMNRMMVTLLRLPLVHRLISKMILLITFTGRKSNQHYTIPVGYFREGPTITLLTKRFRKWWHNFEEPTGVELHIEGYNYQGQAAVLTDSQTMIPILAQVMEAHPREAQIYGVKLLDNGIPDMDSIREIAPKVVVIQINLTLPKGTV